MVSSWVGPFPGQPLHVVSSVEGPFRGQPWHVIAGMDRRLSRPVKAHADI